LNDVKTKKRRALVLGGTGALGSAVAAELSRQAIAVHFTYHQNEEKARSLAEKIAAYASRLDLRDQTGLHKLVVSLEAEEKLPDVVIHCAGVVRRALVDQAGDADWDETFAVHARAAFQVCRELGGRLAKRGGGDIVLVSALDRGQSLPIPATFAASQGAITALAMAAAKDLGPHGVRVNVVSLGLLDAGIAQLLDPKLAEEYKTFSALRRLGTAAEAAQTIAWIALHNSYLNGKVVAANGGI